ncbi:iron-containing alcohol dehydrogenase [Rhizobium ruizarguesonis]|uniref:iron-containing alcohol dehydrogenase n=1 Tax=Rhizobium TaxID=379 RepID=UPI00040B10BA|nr:MULTISPECIES: iron-containing alcohol dehydrogenase [Rhizobium]QIO49541.1 iron-containing alcohol dehydrogenase [Rhizobium leguminosarum bv. trifolii]QJS32609.1 iron-containing alcohol dehydrogenase [Rhizobium leguminosarum bv. trifolii TA1]MDI5929882.1 iron-containing alcohol dehydrogenase [Rhizobium leguminosarum]TAT70373.1 iron-containing alcohol dehydrogenase [Rhizobium ruizarguesonis]TAT71705.1 iron-containing alcohol dehydrogenase [Rhizobium ruizarguesonis]
MTVNPFEFRTVPSIEMAWGGAKRLGEIIAARFAARKVLLVTDAGLVKGGLIAPIAASLEVAGFSVVIFDRVVPDPPESVLYGCVEEARQVAADIVIGLGGGSSLDIAKLAAVLLSSAQPLAKMYGIGKVQGGRVPLVLVPTTAGTGSEVTNISIITTGETTKMGVVSPQLYADFVLLDAELTVGLPQVHTAASGIDAMVHAIEAYTSKHKKNPLSDALAREALRLLGSNLIAACKEPTNRDAREGMLLGAMLAGQAFSNSPVAAVHALAYPLGGHYHIPHGLSNALMLGPVLRYNAQAAAPLYAELADVLGVKGSGDTAARSEDFVTHMQVLMDKSGAPRRLRDVGVTDNSLAMLATDAIKNQGRLLVNNPVEVREEDALALYREAF